VLTTWLLNTSSAKQLGLATTGHASRGLAGPSGVSTSNLTLSTGDRDLAGLMEDAKTGLLVTSMFGPSLNGNTGDWSVGCSGLWFENGEVTYPGHRDHRGRQPDRHLRPPDPGLGPGVPGLEQRAVDPGRRPGDRRQMTDLDLILDAAREAGRTGLESPRRRSEGLVQGRRLAGHRRRPGRRRPAERPPAHRAARLWLAVGGDGR
jgi:hypothetical protein